MSFAVIDVTEQMETKAQNIRLERDKIYGNIYVEKDTDLRWVGDLGEICFNQWLKQEGFCDYHWHLRNSAGNPDFTLGDIKIDIKTVKRKVPPKADYTAQITGRHKDSPADELFFYSYQYLVKKMWLLGGISKTAFISKAQHYKGGENVHSNYQIREGHEIYNAPLSILISSDKWISNLKEKIKSTTAGDSGLE